MNLVWAYSKTKGGMCDLETSLLERFYFIGSVLSFQALFTEASRTLYCDSYVQKLLNEWEITELFTNVVLVNYEKELFKKYNVDFYAYPKLEAMLHQTEPFWIVDTDRVIVEDLKTIKFITNFNEKKYYGDLYSSFLEVQPVHKFLEKDLYPKYLQPLLESSSGINGGFIYYPEPDVAKILALSIFSLVQNVKRGKLSKNFLLFEEVPLLRMLRILGKEIVDTKEMLTFLIHPERETFEKGFNRIYNQKILGVKNSVEIIKKYSKAFPGINAIKLLKKHLM